MYNELLPSELIRDLIIFFIDKFQNSAGIGDSRSWISMTGMFQREALKPIYIVHYQMLLFFIA